MYGLPDDFDGGFLLGQRLIQIRVTQNQIVLQFEEDVTITLEGEFACTPSTSSRTPVRREVPDFDAGLKTLFGQAITGVSSSSARTPNREHRTPNAELGTPNVEPNMNLNTN